MKLTKCANGHFYDAEKFSSCPHCSGGANSSQDDAPTSALSLNTGNASSDDEYTMPIFSGEGSAPSFNRGVTSPVSQTVTSRMPQTSGLQDDEKTVGFMNWNAPGSDAGSRPDNVFQSEAGTQRTQNSPVVGWLVCIKGASYGRAFNLYAGQNFIGRSKSMDISLSDPTVARNRHAILIYEPISRQFYAQAGESHELFYVNDNVVLAGTLLKDRDVLSIGTATFVFVPFCDERYGWIANESEE